MFRKFFEAFKTKHRKHKFDLARPDIVTYNGLMLNGIPFQQTVFTCRACGKQLTLDMKSMCRLPYAMAHGCPGYKKDTHEKK